MLKPELRLSGHFVGQAKTALAPGNWYISFRCVGCARGVAFLDDPTGTGEISVLGDALIEFVCPGCGAANRAGPTQALVVRASTGGVTLPPEIMAPDGAREMN